MNKSWHAVHEYMIAFFRHQVGNYIPVLTGDIGGPVIMTDYNFSITGITARCNKGAAVAGCFVITGSCFFFFQLLRYIIVSKFFHCIQCRDIEAVIFFLLCMQSFNNAIDFIFVFAVKFIPEKISCGTAVKFPVAFGFVKFPTSNLKISR